MVTARLFPKSWIIIPMTILDFIQHLFSLIYKEIEREHFISSTTLPRGIPESAGCKTS